MKKYEEYQFWHCKAEEEFDLACEAVDAGLLITAEQHYEWHWRYLLRSADIKWHIKNVFPEPSWKQKESQRLWIQRGLLERTRANLRAVMEEMKSLEVGYAVTLCDRYIEKNKAAFASLKERQYEQG